MYFVGTLQTILSACQIGLFHSAAQQRIALHTLRRGKYRTFCLWYTRNVIVYFFYSLFLVLSFHNYIFSSANYPCNIQAVFTSYILCFPLKTTLRLLVIKVNEEFLSVTKEAHCYFLFLSSNIISVYVFSVLSFLNNHFPLQHLQTPLFSATLTKYYFFI